MPFESVQDLRQSELFSRLQTLREFSSEQLERFVRTFNAVFERVKRNGGSEDDAEAQAIPIALSGARRARIAASVPPLDDETHFFVPHMPDQFGASAGGGGIVHHLDFTLVESAPEIVNAMVAGNVFTMNHGGPALGVIKRVLLRDEVPESIASFVDVEAPMVFEASFFQHVPDRIRNLEGISAEWVSAELSNGRSLAIPETFVMTTQPMNEPHTGIKRVAAIESEPDAFRKLYDTVSADGRTEVLKARFASPDDERLPIHDAEHVLKSMAELHDVEDVDQEQAARHILRAAKRFEVPTTREFASKFGAGSLWDRLFGGNRNESAVGMDSNMAPDAGSDGVTVEELQEQLQAREAALDELKTEREKDAERLAKAEAGLEILSKLEAALGSENDDDPEPDKLAARVASLKEANDSLSETNEDLAKRLAALEEERLDERAETFCKEHLAGRVPTEAWPQWQKLYKADAEQAKGLAENLPVTGLGNDDSDATQMQGEEIDQLDAAIDAALGLKSEESDD